MAKIENLVSDIENVLLNGAKDANPIKIQKFGQLVSKTILERLNQDKKEFTLRMSNIGNKCVRKLWLEKNFPDQREKLSAATKLKFLYGDLIESLILFLVELTGHDVKGEQDELQIAGIKGHRDVVVDGHLLDIKSASPYSFENFKQGLTKDSDKFGYIPQLMSYLEASKDDPVVSDKDNASFLVVDKVSGELCLDSHKKNVDIDWEASYNERIEVVEGSEIPERGFTPEADGYKNPKTKEFIFNGNEILGTQCSYCQVKHLCHPGLRTFVGKNSIKYYTKVEKEPTKLIEIKKEQETENSINENMY